MSDRIEAPDDRGELGGLWTVLVETASNAESPELRDLAAEWAAELPRRFDFEPPLDGWLSVDLDDEDDETPRASAST